MPGSLFKNLLYRTPHKECEQERSLPMDSLRVDLLFTNILFDKTIDICNNQLFEKSDTGYKF